MAGRVALVTGSSSGIGRVTAQALAADGFRVVLAARRREALDEAVAEITAAGGTAMAVAADVTDETSVAELFRAAVDAYGRVDVAFNNAGMNPPQHSFEDTPFDVWNRIVSVNLTGVFLCMREAFRVMKAQEPRGGRIINNGSISAQLPRPFAAPYAASKHGVTGLTRQGALDGRAFDIACGQIDIGNAATEMTARMTGGVTQADGTQAPEPRMDAKHVADAVVYMANLPVDVNVFTMTVMANQMPFAGRG